MRVPKTLRDLSPEILTDMISARHPGVKVERVDIKEVKDESDLETSSSGRVLLDVKYDKDAPPDLPRSLVIKMSFDSSDGWYSRLTALYSNEVLFYERIRPGLDVETARCLGGTLDPGSNRYVLILEDLTKRGVQFPTVLDDVSPHQVRNGLRTLARLHAKFWESPRFQGDLSWVETHLHGKVEDMMNGIIRQGIQSGLAAVKFKQDLVGLMGTSEEELHAGVLAVKKHQATLPRTLLHGDTHIANTYLMPDGNVGLHDWQLLVRGNSIHDVVYFISTALSIENRRTHERQLLAFYRESLLENGVKNVQNMEDLWLEYRRAAIWGVYIGWLTVPPIAYGWPICSVASLRVVTAYVDHGTRKLVAELL